MKHIRISLFGGALLVAACADESQGPQVSVMDEEVSDPTVDPERTGWPQDVAISIDRGCIDPECRTGRIAVDVTSLRRDRVGIQVYLSASGLDDRTARIRIDGVSQGTVPLEGGERRRFFVDAFAMPIQPLGTIATAQAELAIAVADTMFGSVSSPVAFESDPGFKTFTLYDDRAALDRGARLDPRVVEAPAGRMWDGKAYVDLRTLPPHGGEGFTVAGATTTLADRVAVPLPEPPPPPVGTKVCFDLKVKYNDAGIGEDYVNTPPSGGTPAVQVQNAAYMRAWITKSGVLGNTWDGYLNSIGCTPAKSLSGTYTIHVQSKFEKLIGGVAADHDVKLHSSGGDDVQQWNRAFTVSGAPPSVTVEGSSATHTTNVSGVLARMYAGTDSWIPTGTKTTYVDKGCPGLNPPTDSCYNGSVYIGPGAAPAPAQALDKFLVAHEYGHFAQFNNFTLYGFDYDSVQAGVAACRCDHVVSANQLHCMQSLEQYAAAMVEGFAHFYSAKLYNNRLQTDCEYGYYKEVFALFVTLTPTVPVTCASTSEWRDSHCPGIASSAVEMDVMRFLWALYSTLPDRLTMDEIGDLLHAAQTNAGVNPIKWSNVKSAAATVFGNPSAKYTKVVNQGAIHSVD